MGYPNWHQICRRGQWTGHAKGSDRRGWYGQVRNRHDQRPAETARTLNERFGSQVAAEIAVRAECQQLNKT